MQVSKVNQRNLPFKEKKNHTATLCEIKILVSGNMCLLLLLFCDQHLNHTHSHTLKHTKKISHMEILYTILAILTCFFFCASLLSAAGVVTSKVFCAAFKAAGLYTVFVRPVDVDNTYQYKFNFFKKCINHSKFLKSYLL